MHGSARVIDVATPAQAGVRRALLDIYVPRYGPEWETFLDRETAYARIDAERMFVFAMDPDGEGPAAERRGAP
jgi:hypothetical protein